jgi:signal transduction histidine kinase
MLDPASLVGIGSIIYHWDTMLTKYSASKNSEFIDVVVSDQKQTNTFTYVDKKSILKRSGKGDLHDPDYREYKIHRCDFADSIFNFYSITFYPTKQYFSFNFWSWPLIGAILSSSLVIIIACVFISYNSRVKKRLYETEEILEAKRKFVSFISHELRTPLNTVCIGLKVIGDEIKSSITDDWCNDNMQSKVNEVLDSGGKNHIVICEKKSSTYSKEKLLSWIDLIQDLEDNSGNAVTVLNELMSYDKIEMKTYHIEKEMISVWKIISDSIKPFHIQAREKSIKIILTMDINDENITTANRDSLNKLCLIGDPMKLEQVFRNIVSNALKYSKSNTKIMIDAKWHPNFHLPEGLVCFFYRFKKKIFSYIF